MFSDIKIVFRFYRFEPKIRIIVYMIVKIVVFFIELLYE